MIGARRRLRFRIPSPDADAPRPEAGDYLRGPRAVYRITAAKLARDVVEPWDAGGWPDDPLDGVLMRVLHYRLDVLRILPDDRPEDAMTWDFKPDRPRGRRSRR